MTSKEIFCYYESSKELPKDGWFQQCFCCNKITSRTILQNIIKYKKKDYFFHFYICKSCNNERKSKKINMDYFDNECYIFLKHQYPKLF